MSTSIRRHRNRSAQSMSPSMKIRNNSDTSASKATPQPILTGSSTPAGKGFPIAPRTVTPLSNLRSSTPSWEDYDEGVFGAAQKAQRNKDRGVSFPNSISGKFSKSLSFEDNDDMPMDELIGTNTSSVKRSITVQPKGTNHSSSNRNVEPAIARPFSSSVGESNLARMAAAIQSKSRTPPGGLSQEERILWDKMRMAVTQASKSGMTVDSSGSARIRETELEMQLSESETKIGQLKQKLRHHNFESDATSVSSAAASTKHFNHLEEQLRESKAEVKKRENEHDSEVRAIQRVLAEMTTEREEETQILNDTVAALSRKIETLDQGKKTDWGPTGAPPPAPTASTARPTSASESGSKAAADKHEDEIAKLQTTVKDLETEKIASKKDIERKARRLMVLERDYKVAKVQLKKSEESKKLPKQVSTLDKEIETLKVEIEDVKGRNHKLQAEVDVANKERKARRKPLGSMTPPRPESVNNTDTESVSSAVSAEEVESLQKNLCDTSSSLENAKKIIASLENASGSMAVDLRAKLKAKEEELATVQNESADRKRRLDSLATELRDLQKNQDDVDRLEKESKSQIIRHKALMGLLEKSVSELQSASVVHEVSTATGQPDPANIDQIAEVLSDTMIGIRTSLELSEQYIDEFDDASTVAFTDVDVSSEVGRQIDAIIKNDREALAKSTKDELEQKKVAVRRLEEALKKQNEEIRRLRSGNKSSGENNELLAEIQSLREQCSTNMDVLAKKERELSVLRSSLKVDEYDAGYISDDASDGEDDENDTALSSAKLNGYDAAQTEALASLVAAGGSIPGQDSNFQGEFLKALDEKDKASKALQAERESLANAKLIISSLEKANKSMMEDLRSRLQDSNTAIASLLDKSMEHEKNSNELREEVEKQKKEREEAESRHKDQSKKLKDETKVYSLRIASKERELNDLRRGADAKQTFEEKKETEEEENTGSF